MNHLDTHSILTDSQYGYQPKHSREAQLITLLHDIVRDLDGRDIKQADVIDFAKASDKIPHKRLTPKL